MVRLAGGSNWGVWFSFSFSLLTDPMQCDSVAPGLFRILRALFAACFVVIVTWGEGGGCVSECDSIGRL